jgi:hypothetical protein
MDNRFPPWVLCHVGGRWLLVVVFQNQHEYKRRGRRVVLSHHFCYIGSRYEEDSGLAHHQRYNSSSLRDELRPSRLACATAIILQPTAMKSTQI